MTLKASSLAAAARIAAAVATNAARVALQRCSMPCLAAQLSRARL